jgi:thiol-disulfide isomerase/thioredoxin
MNGTVLKMFLGFAALAPVLVRAQPTPNVVLAQHAKELIILKGQTLAAFNADRFLQAPYTVLYFGAGWCPDCRRFSPSLAAAYDHQASGVKRFEVLLLSQDKNAEGMFKFMSSEKMKWPALEFGKLDQAKDLTRFYTGHGIPCLTVIDRQGNIVLQSKDGLLHTGTDVRINLFD